MEITVHIAEMPLAPMAIPPAQQLADNTNPSAIDSRVEMTKFLSSSKSTGLPAMR
ncbi:hypothetical protein [Lysinibacillus sp. D4A3_S15]|uniref:hypothetical protein n=1 Tax=Lysinibacillus sp. D4A3_S15 TaxID=2941227 RepID=UPI0020C04756|nr:hypothetical protein [Lysinibacillus sp. D4A3_S15]